MGGTMRLGAYPARAGRRARSWPRPTARTEVTERHRHRYEVNNAYRDRLTEAGLVVSGTLAGRPAGRVRRAARATCTRSSSAPRRTRSSRAGRPGRTRCSRRSSAPRSTTSAADRLPVDDREPATAGRRPATMDASGRAGVPRVTDFDVVVLRRPSTPGRCSTLRRDQVADARRRHGRPRGRRARRGGRRRRARRRRPGGADPPVPAPGRRHLWELPAGLLDVAGEDAAGRPRGASWPRRSALAAGRWRLLVDVTPSPGLLRPRRCGSSWPGTCAGARRRRGTRRSDEEADLDVAPGGRWTRRWPWCSPGEISNAPCTRRPACSRDRRSTREARDLRPAHAPWPAA